MQGARSSYFKEDWTSKRLIPSDACYKRYLKIDFSNFKTVFYILNKFMKYKYLNTHGQIYPDLLISSPLRFTSTTEIIFHNKNDAKKGENVIILTMFNCGAVHTIPWNDMV